MTGTDVEVICGEWDTATSLGEKYNVILPIEKITRHPEFYISRGEQNSQFVANDIAVLHVRSNTFGIDSVVKRIYPACLPTLEQDNSKKVHSGWSLPPPMDFVVENVPLYIPFYKYFSAQWHYSMEVSQN